MEYCSQHNVQLHYGCYHCQTKLFSQSYLLSFSRFSYCQNMFWSKNLGSNMPKITSFLLKNRKNRPALEALPPDPLCLRRLGATLPDPHISPRGGGLEDNFWSPWPWSWPRTLQVLENWPLLGRGQQLFASF